MKTQAMLMGMRYLNPQECEITKVVTLTDQDYDYFQNNLLERYEFIQNNQRYMGYEGNTPRCLLVMGENSGDGILVNSEGPARACRMAHFPEAAAFLMDHSHELTEDGVALRMLTQDDVTIMQALHILWKFEHPGGKQADFSNCYLSVVDFHGMEFSEAIFRGALLEDCYFAKSAMRECDFTGARFIRCKSGDLVAEGCNFREAIFEDSNFESARLIGSDFTGAVMENTRFWDTAVEQNVQNEEEVEQSNLSQGACGVECVAEQQWMREEDLTLTVGGM